jgi:hypothetical protein
VLHAEFLADVGVQLLDLLGVAEAVEHDVRALFGQRAGDAEADARGRAGDEGGLAAQTCWISLKSSVGYL